MTPKEILIAARTLLTPEHRWTQGYSAKTADGTRTTIYGGEATCWSARGAIAKVAPTTGRPVAELEAAARLEDAVACLGSASITAFNDHPQRTQADVLAAFDLAIGHAPGDA